MLRIYTVCLLLHQILLSHGASLLTNEVTLPKLQFERKWKTKINHTVMGYGSVSMEIEGDTVFVLNGAEVGNAIVLFGLDGVYKGEFPGWYNWPFDITLGGNPSSPQPLLSALGAMNDAGNLDFGMVLYNDKGGFFHGFMEEDTGLERPYGLARMPGGQQVAVCDWHKNRTVILDVSWLEGEVSASSDPEISVPYPFRIAVTTGPGSANSTVIHRYIISSQVCCEPWHEAMNALSIFDGNGKLLKVVKDLPTGERIKSPDAVAADPNGNILMVDSYMKQAKTHFFDDEGNYVGVIEELGAPNKIVFYDGKVYALTEDKDENFEAYVNVFSYSN